MFKSLNMNSKTEGSSLNCFTINKTTCFWQRGGVRRVDGIGNIARNTDTNG